MRISTTFMPCNHWLLQNSIDEAVLVIYNFDILNDERKFSYNESILHVYMEMS
jgi:hypothetical protein